MKILRFAVLFALLTLCPRADAFLHRGSNILVNHGSQVSLDALGSATETPFIDMMKEANEWNYSDTNLGLLPSDLDSNGLPKQGGAWISRTGAKNLVYVTPQSHRPGNWVLIWTGARAFQVFSNNATATQISCTGSSSSGCDNTGCSTFTGSISAAVLTVTVAPTGSGCGLTAGLPISGAGVKVGTFGALTVITAQLTGTTGGVGTYSVNQSQTVGSETLHMGGRVQISLSNEGFTGNNAYNSSLIVQEVAATTDGVTSSLALYNVNDEADYWASGSPCPGKAQSQACILSRIFRTRNAQANYLVTRDLDWSHGNTSNCTTWSSRKPVTHFSYAASEMRNAAAGNETYVAGGHTYTIPKIGQYVDATGSGASGGTVSYATDTYTVTLGTGAPVDKQTFIMLPPHDATNNTTITFNGTVVPILNALGRPLSTGSDWIPLAGYLTAMTYDANLGGFMSYGGTNQYDVGITCGVPPEVFIEANAELGTTPWHNLGAHSLDPMTDWVTQFATYAKATYTPPSLPTFEVINEPWNCFFGPYFPTYISAISATFVTADTNHAWAAGFTCGANGNLYGEVAKMAVTTAQDLDAVYGFGNYELTGNVQTGYFGSANDILQTIGYVGQSMPAQTGYAKDYSYKHFTRISNAQYWSVTDVGTGTEVALAYCYFYYSVSTSCQTAYVTQAAVMSAYMASSASAISGAASLYAQWSGWAAKCSFVSRPAGCTLNLTHPLFGYEGGYDNQFSGGDLTQAIVDAQSSGSNTILSVPANACQAGQPVNISGMNLAGWPSGANGNYTVVSATANTCTIVLNSSTYGSFGAWRTTVTANSAAGVFDISVASCTGAAPAQSIFDETTGNYIGILSGNGCVSNQMSINSPGAAAAVTSGDVLVMVDNQVGAPYGTPITYTGSQNYVNFLRGASYFAPDLDAAHTAFYNAFINNGGVNPSQYQMGSAGNLPQANPWYVWCTDLYGYCTVAYSAAMSISGNNATIGSTVTGMFRVGDTLQGQGVTGVGTGAGSNTTITSCTPIGSNPCGTTVGDVLGLSQSSTVGVASTPATANTVFSGATVSIGSCAGVQAGFNVYDITANHVVGPVISCSGGNMSINGGAQVAVTTGDNLSVGTQMTGSATPQPNQAGNSTTSPVRAWGAICRWNGNGSQCNG